MKEVFMKRKNIIINWPILIVTLLLTLGIVYVTSSKYFSSLSAVVNLTVRRPEYTVEFYSNRDDGEQEEVTDQNFVYGIEQQLNENQYTYEGYSFAGWNTKRDGTGTDYDDQEVVNNLTFIDGGVVKLYAQWGGEPYYVAFHENGGQGTMETQEFRYGISQKLSKNLFTKTDYKFAGWNTEEDGSGTTYSDEQEVLNLANSGTVDLYAQWGQGVAVVNGVYYDSLQEAIDAVPTNNTETLVRLLTDTNENLIVAKNKNIVFDLQNFTVKNLNTSNNDDAVIANAGTIKITNGTLRTDSKKTGAINNTGSLVMTGGNIIVEAGGRQAIYNNGGNLEISGSAYLKSEGNQGNSQRATVHNLASGTLKITGGTIISTNFNAVYNVKGTMTIGEKDGTVDTNSPIIQGGINGVNSAVSFSFYDGIIKGRTEAINDKTKITQKEENCEVASSEETIDGKLYKTAYLANTVAVTFNPNGGYINENIRQIEIGNPVGTLPIPTKAGYELVGWFTQSTGGEQISASTIITSAVTYYAHWKQVMTAELDGTQYTTIQKAIDAVPKNNTEKTITILKNTNENIKIYANQNVVLDLQDNKLLNNGSGNPVISNYGTLAISSGTVESNVDYATINNYQGGTLKISGGNILAKGTRGSIYNTGGNIEISGSAYLCSAATGSASNGALGRATINNLQNGTVTVTGGTIIGLNQQALSNENATLIIGTKDGNIDTTSPTIVGETYGLVHTSTFNFYDGTIKGIQAAISGDITEREEDSQIVDGTYVDGEKTYLTQHLESTQ